MPPGIHARGSTLGLYFGFRPDYGLVVLRVKVSVFE
jgi:hypothetical protein